jgi:hypothetical protein
VAFSPRELVGVVTGRDDPRGIDVLDIDVEHLAALFVVAS